MCATVLLCCMQCETSKASEISMDHIKWPGTEKMEKALTASRTSVVLDGANGAKAVLWRSLEAQISQNKIR